jgi:hypothetical protein
VGLEREAHLLERGRHLSERKKGVGTTRGELSPPKGRTRERRRAHVNFLGEMLRFEEGGA